jgi:hypothetical protein
MPELSPDCHFKQYLINRGRAGPERGLQGKKSSRENAKKRMQKIIKAWIDPCPAKITRIKRRKHEPVNTLQASQIRKKRIPFIG